MPDRPHLISQLCAAARERDGAEQAAFLTAACAGDPSLRHEVESVLRRERGEGLATVAARANNRLDTGLTTLPITDGVGFQPGMVVGERYRIVGLLGRGAMGEVYRADDLKVGQRVALKFLPMHFTVDASRVNRFVNEVRLARQISHPNVCRVYDIGEADGRHYLSMEFIDGEDLASLLRRIGRLPHEKVLEIARQLCAGLAAAHDQGVLHRDLKPANIMIDGRGHARIADFGLAVTAPSRTAEEIAGTPAYMAPEQVVGGTLTARTDIFALGLILHELLTGKRVFQASTLQQRWLTDRDVADLPFSANEGDIDPILQNVIARCLKMDPAARPASVRSVAAALPGGADPLLAALAAGEIPSPEMVAVAGEAHGFPPTLAWMCLALAFIGLAIAAWQVQPMMLYRQVALTKPPEALVERAQQVVTKLGYTEVPVDSAYWFVSTPTYAELAVERSGLYEPFVRVSGPSERSGAFFVYRQSPQFLVPENTLGVVQYREPPADVPGMADVTLDPLGRLVRFTAVPGAFRGSATARYPDWSVPFSEAGLDFSAFRPTTTTWSPPVAYDVVTAWQGARADRPAERLHIMAAAWEGRPVVFDTTGSPVSATMNKSVRAGGRAFQLAFVAMTLTALLGAALLARWNIRQGRWDRSGALKVAGYVFVLGLFVGFLRADHVPIAKDEYLMFSRIAGWMLYSAGFTFLMYAAFEPFVRQRWPRVLTSWTRLLSGRFRDPLVGRDILIGAVSGVAVALFRESEFIASRWFGFRSPAPFTSTLDGLGSWRQFASLAVFVHVEALSLALAWLLILLLLRIVVRDNKLATLGAIIVVLPLVTLPGNYLLIDLSLAGLVAALSVFVLLRFGLFALVVEISFANALTRLPITLNSSDWYAGRSLVVLLCLTALIAYGFHASFAGRKLFGRDLVNG
jgi:serine/threonine-protein kinase